MVEPSIGADDRPTLLVVGAASRDIHTPDPRGWRLGGTISYSSIAAARLGVRVRALIGVDEAAATAAELDVLRDAGVEVHLVGLSTGPIFDNRQTPTGRVQHAHSASDRVRVGGLPLGWSTPDYALLGPVAGELSDEWAGVFPETTFVALAAQGLVRALTPGKLVKRLPLRRTALVTRADAMLVSAEDIAAGAPPVRELLRPGQELLVTNGAQGALQLRRDGSRLRGRYMPPLPRREAIDPTGAGDVFLAAWLATRMLTGGGRDDDDRGWRALAVASAMASLSVERQTLEETPTLADLCAVLIKLRGRHLD